MSLLMEALRRAQQVQEKAAEGGENGNPSKTAVRPAAEELTPTPDVRKNTLRKETVEETLELELLDEEPLTRDNWQTEVKTEKELTPPPDEPKATHVGDLSPVKPLAPTPAEDRTVAAGSPRDEAFGRSQEASRQAAQAMFLAKKRQQRRSGRRRMLLITLLALAGAAAGGGFLLLSSRDIWLHSPPIAQPQANVPAHSPPVPEREQTFAAVAIDQVSFADTADQQPPPGGETMVLATAVSSEPEQPASEAEVSLSPPVPIPAVESAVVTPISTVTEPLFSGESTAPATAEGAAAAIRYEPTPLSLAETPPAIRITRQTLTPQSDIRLAEANSAFQQGRIEQARILYQQIIGQSPGNRGARLGLAALAVQDSNITLAEQLYLDLLRQDPADPLARAGLISIIPKTNLLPLESELKRLLAIHPDLPPLSFLLGNLYAAGQRWPEAQQEYFQALEAITRDQSTENALTPDYPFNLAVSLEHLNQPSAAAGYYRQALQLADSHPAGFNREVVRQRLAELEQGGWQ